MSEPEVSRHYPANPILTAHDPPHPVDDAFDPAAAELDGKTTLLVRVEGTAGASLVSPLPSRPTMSMVRPPSMSSS
jgi:predicted GH43/DUF377 family glycosyl hydrolase